MVTRENGTVGAGVVEVVVVDVVLVLVVVVVDDVVGVAGKALVLLGLFLTLQNGTWPSQ